jgi:hypothetical protein
VAFSILTIAAMASCVEDAAFAQNRASAHASQPMIASFGFEPPSVGGSWLVEESVFRLLLELEIQKAQRFRHSVSLVCLTAELASPGNGRPSECEPSGHGYRQIQALRRLHAAAAIRRRRMAKAASAFSEPRSDHRPSLGESPR